MQDTVEHRIRARAHQLWEDEGRPEGRAEHHWYEARRLVEIEGTMQPPKKAAARSRRKKAN